MIDTDTLKKNYEFKNVLSKGKFFSGDYINIYIRQNHRRKNYIGIAVGVKIAKATKRNRLKRLIRENYSLLESNIKKGNDIVFLWKKSKKVEDANFNYIKMDMIKIFTKANLLKEDDIER